MFEKNFPGNSLIKKIEISGSFITVYMPEDQFLNFIEERYKKLFEAYRPLYEEENYGSIHDYAHNSKGVHSEPQDDHIHFYLPTLVNQDSLMLFLSYFDDEDLSPIQKQEFLQDFQNFTSTPSIEYLLELIKPYDYISNAAFFEVSKEEHFLDDAMPLFVEFIYQLNQSPTLEKISLHGNELQTESAKAAQHAFYSHTQWISRFEKELENYHTNQLNKLELIEKLQHFFNNVSLIPLPDFKSLLPSLHNELAQNLPFIDEKFNDFYATLAEQLTIILDAKNLHFIPKSSVSTSEFTMVSIGKKFGTPVYDRVNYKNNHSNGKDTPKKKLNFFTEENQSFEQNSSAKVVPIREEVNYENQSFVQTNYTEEDPIADEVNDDNYDQALDRLKRHSKASQCIIGSMIRLKKGVESWNPYWIDSEVKLNGIIEAVLKIKLDDDIENLIKNEESNLYSALNMQRFLPITFLGRLGINRAKSIRMVEDEISNINEQELSL